MPWLSLPDYARRTGTPESTVRALIRAGKLEAHQEQRAPGDPRIVWKVLVDEPATETSSGHPQPPAAPMMASESPQQQPPTIEPPAATTRALEILAEALEGERAERRRLAVDLLAATERAARAEAESAARAAALDWTDARRAEAEAEVARLRARRWFDPRTW